MKRLAALFLGAAAGIAATRLVRRRRATQPDAVERSDPGSTGTDVAGDQAAELRRKLDQAREREGVASSESADALAEDVVGEARLEPERDDGAQDATSGPNGGEGVEELADRRARVHERARCAAEAMRGDDDPGAV